MSALVELARSAVAVRSASYDMTEVVERFGVHVAEKLHPLFQCRNGFYAFEQALHVLSDMGSINEKGLVEWNSDALWRGNYDGMADDAVFFAEDVFGIQFCIREGSVATFEPETGRFEWMAADVEEWAQIVRDDYQFWTGYKVAHDWQIEHGPIPLGSRLVPKVPFVLGGDYTVANMHVLEAVKGMRYRASIAVQIRDLPDGSPVTLRVVE
jgi:hypothetical protein